MNKKLGKFLKSLREKNIGTLMETAKVLHVIENSYKPTTIRDYIIGFEREGGEFLLAVSGEKPLIRDYLYLYITAISTDGKERKELIKRIKNYVPPV